MPNRSQQLNPNGWPLVPFHFVTSDQSIICWLRFPSYLVECWLPDRDNRLNRCYWLCRLRCKADYRHPDSESRQKRNSVATQPPNRLWYWWTSWHFPCRWNCIFYNWFRKKNRRRRYKSALPHYRSFQLKCVLIDHKVPLQWFYRFGYWFRNWRQCYIHHVLMWRLYDRLRRLSHKQEVRSIHSAHRPI